MLFAAFILIFSGLTDLFDGFLARRFGWVSQVGKVLDPLADKLTQITICVLFAVTLGGLLWIFFAVLVFKEFVMLLLGAYFYKKGVKLEGARFLGKMTTVLFYLAVIVIALVPALPAFVIYAMLAVVTVSAIIAGVLYWPDFVAYRQESSKRS